jgi:ABC-type glycerol-3-phosphate transport system substrate-binding protein
MFSAGVFASSDMPDEAMRLVKFLASPEAAAALEAAGLVPVR